MSAPAEHSGGSVHWGALLIAAAAALVFGGLCGYFYRGYHDTPAQTNGDVPQSSNNSDKVSCLGRIEPEHGILSLGVPVPDRIRQLCVKEGANVKKDDVLAVLDSEELRRRELESAHLEREHAKIRLQAITASGNAQIQVEELRRDRAEKLEPLEIKAIENKIAFLKAQVSNARINSERYVAAGDTVSAQVREKQDLALREARSERLATESQLDKLRTSGELDRRVAGAQLQALRKELEQKKNAISLKLLDAQIKQTEERLNDTKLLAPSEGKILRILVREGELVSAKPILQMANTQPMIVLAEVYEGDIERIQIGQTATITSDVGHIFTKDKNALKGKVIEKASIVGKARVVSTDPLAAVDRRVVEVKVELNLDTEQAKMVAKLIGHQVRVEIDTTRSDRDITSARN